ncbi:PIG-L deacetylase family protein [Falsiroseomonas sp. HW251]|uniref:PIG-L deacetylase family protein n=1 Tax=Falsiroseomonas sp. HW251 TaxID=3390998 RepID=UPI003D319065
MSAEAILAGIAAGGTARLLVIAAHPDDETIGLGALLCRNPDSAVLHVTDGAPRDGRDAARHGFASVEDYALARRREALAALAIAGIPEERVLTLGIADQQTTLHLVPVAHRLTEAIHALRPDIVVTHAYEGGHPDHDAVAFAVRAALRALRSPPPLAEMTGYHAGPRGLEAGRFLPPEERAFAFPLGQEEAAKRRMLDAYATQRAVLSAFPLRTEWLRPAPEADFAQPPHPGTLFYEGHDWNMDGAMFRALAAAAQQGLGPMPWR